MQRQEFQGRAEAEHKEFVREYKTFKGVIQATRDIILEAVDHEYLLEIEDKILGFLNQTPNDMLTHLQNQGGALDFAGAKTLLAERDGEWDASKVPHIYFSRVEKTIQRLTHAGITSDLTNIKTWCSTISKHQENSMQQSGNGNRYQRFRKHGRTSKLSSQQESAQKKTSAEQTHCKEFQSKHDQGVSQSNEETDCLPNQDPYMPDGNTHQKHHQCHEGNDVPHQE
jgi:hypothetical protein